MIAGLLNFFNRHATVTPQDIEELMEFVEIRSYDKKVKLTDIGEVAENIHFILSGLARKYFFKGKQEIITHIVKEGGLISSAASFFSGKPSKYIVETLEQTKVISLSRQNLEKLFEKDKKWERITRLLMGNYFIVQEIQVLDNIRLSTKERLRKFINENPDLMERVPQKSIASLLHIKPETFSRLKKDVKN